MEFEDVDKDTLKKKAEPYYLENHRIRRKNNNTIVPTITERKMLL